MRTGYKGSHFHRSRTRHPFLSPTDGDEEPDPAFDAELMADCAEEFSRNVDEYIADLQSDDIARHQQAMRALLDGPLRFCAWGASTLLVESGLLALVLSHYDSPSITFVLDVLARLCTSPMEESEELIRRGILPVLLQGLLRRDPGLSQMAASALVELLRTGEGKFFAALLYSIGVVSAMSEFLETSPHDDLAIPLCDVFNALSQLSALPTDSKDRFLAHRTSFLENCPNPDYFDEELFDIFLTTGIMLDKPCMSLISTFLASPNENVIAPLLAALSRLIQVNPDDYVQFLIVGRPIAHRFEEWIATGNRALVSEVAQFIFTLFSPSVEEVPIFSAGITSLETLVHILELPELDELVQKTAIYAMYNLCEGDGGLTAHFQTPEVTEWLLRLADSPSFFVRRAVVQLFVSVDMRRPASGMRTDLTRRVMDSIVDLIDGYRGEMLEALINRLGILFRRACEAGDCEVIADFERMGGVDALYTVMDDEMACGKAQERAVALFDAFFNHALISE